MKIIVLIKQVPDTEGDRVLDQATGTLDRTLSDNVADEINERALEVALQHKDGHKGSRVVALSMGPSPAAEALRKALAMGADEAVHVADDRLAGADVTGTAAVLAAAARSIGFDLLVAGNESTDGRGGVVPAMIAEHLGLPLLPSLETVRLSVGDVAGEVNVESAQLSLRAALPAVVSVTERSAEARFPGFKGIMTAKRKPYATLTLADLGLDAASVSVASTVTSVTQRPPRTAGKIVVDEGAAAHELIDFLAAGRLI
jgi:electron transfer flavoprotein beta subunit